MIITPVLNPGNGVGFEVGSKSGTIMLVFVWVLLLTLLKVQQLQAAR